MERRTFLRSASVLTGLAVAGCSTNGGDGGDGGDGGSTIPGGDYPAVDEWMTETSVGDADDTYDGTILDARTGEPPTIDVGADGNGGAYAFAPTAIAVTPGTTLNWVWTGEGQQHNVVAAPDDQLGESDYEFSSGDPVAEAGTEFSYAFDETGVALYHCVPHLALGMKGAVVVAES